MKQIAVRVESNECNISSLFHIIPNMLGNVILFHHMIKSRFVSTIVSNTRLHNQETYQEDDYSLAEAFEYTL